MKQTKRDIPGYPHTPKSKKDISKSVKKSWEDETIRNNHLRGIQKINVRKTLSVKGQGIDIKDWEGFTSFEPYTKEFNDKFKRAIRKRDNYICLKCGKHQEKEKHSLVVHHINYDKKLTIKENCCTVCRNCNNEVNINRKHWTKFFQSLLSEKYGYQYNDKCEIILKLNKQEK